MSSFVSTILQQPPSNNWKSKAHVALDKETFPLYFIGSDHPSVNLITIFSFRLGVKTNMKKENNLSYRKN